MQSPNPPPPPPSVACSLHAYSFIQQSSRSVKTMNAKNTKKSTIHENADANITCDFGDGAISRFRSRLLHKRLARLYLDCHTDTPIQLNAIVPSNLCLRKLKCACDVGCEGTVFKYLHCSASQGLFSFPLIMTRTISTGCCIYF